MNSFILTSKIRRGAITVVAFGAVFVATLPAQAGDIVIGDGPGAVHGKVIRGRFGANFTSYHALPENTPARQAAALHLRIGVSLAASAYTSLSRRRPRQQGFSLYDEFYLEMNVGGMLSEPLTHYKTTEWRFATTAQFGYELAAGWQFPRVGVWGGIRLAGDIGTIGATSIPGSGYIAGNYPLLARADIALTPNVHIIAMPWVSAFGQYRSVGGEVEVSLSSRFYLGIRANHLYGGDVTIPTSDAFSLPGGAATSGTLYIRVGDDF